ncbi:unnamed protein product [Symbiodinium microadriaticum]|nr:unnamed protein product [Symbiodinium microadriaticum]
MTGKNGSKCKAVSKGQGLPPPQDQKVSKDRKVSSVSACSSKGKAISKTYIKGSNDKGFKGTLGNRFEGIGKARSTADDARQSAIGLHVARELAQALAILDKMKDGRGFCKHGGQRRPIRVPLHCYGGMNRTCGACCALVMALASMTVESAIASPVDPAPRLLRSIQGAAHLQTLIIDKVTPVLAVEIVSSRAGCADMVNRDRSTGADNLELAAVGVESMTENKWLKALQDPNDRNAFVDETVEDENDSSEFEPEWPLAGVAHAVVSTAAEAAQHL